jgi:hypothetical protein
MFRHYRVILRELVINTWPNYTSTANAALVIQFTITIYMVMQFTIKIYMVIQFTIKMFHTGDTGFTYFVKPSGCVCFQ